MANPLSGLFHYLKYPQGMHEVCPSSAKGAAQREGLGFPIGSYKDPIRGSNLETLALLEPPPLADLGHATCMPWGILVRVYAH